MPDDKERRPFGFLRRFLRRLCGGFGGLFHLAARFQRFDISWVLGKEETVARMKRAVEVFGKGPFCVF